MTRRCLDLALLDVMRAQAALAPRLAELASAARHGNTDRVGNAAYDAQRAGDALSSALSRVFAHAAELSAALFEEER